MVCSTRPTIPRDSIVDTTDTTSDRPLRDFLLGPALNLFIIVVLTLFSLWLVRVAERRIAARLTREDGDRERQARLATFLNVGKHTADTIIIGIGIMMGLLAMGIDIGPALAAAGVVGIGISLGAQTLIKDYIGGLIILGEDQFRVGDTIEVANVMGVVEKVTLRTTALRDLKGRVIYVPNGDVRTLANLSRDWSRAIIDLNVNLDADMGQVVKALEQAVARAQADPNLSDKLVGEPEILGWNSFNDWAVQVRLMAKTRPNEQALVSRVLRQYALEALNEASVRLAVPRQDLRTIPADAPPPPSPDA